MVRESGNGFGLCAIGGVAGYWEKRGVSGQPSNERRIEASDSLCWSLSVGRMKILRDPRYGAERCRWKRQPIVNRFGFLYGIVGN